MKRLTFLSLLIVATVMAGAQNRYEAFTRDLPFKMADISAPVFPSNEVVLTRFGAVGDGQTLCTQAFARAITALEKKGGGRLVVPRGVWLTGPIELRSNIDLHLEMGAVIQFAADETLYPLVNTSFEGLDTWRCQSPLSGHDLVNVAITGQGVIDGNGQYWRPLKKAKLTEAQWREFTSREGGIELRKGYWVPSEGYAKGEAGANMNVPSARTKEECEAVKRFLRPVMVNLVRCKNVLLQDVIFQNSPAWNLHPLMCENVIIDHVLVRNPAYAQNGDALDLESCKNALIVDSKFDAGDDGICLKSGKDADGRRRGIPCENVVVQGCTVFAGHGGFVVGSEMSGGVRNIVVRQCQFLGTDVGLRFKSTRGRGGIVENIYVDGISMTGIKTYALTFNMYYGGKSVAEVMAEGGTQTAAAAVPVDETTPIFRNIDIRNVVCRDAGMPIEFNGLPEMPIDGITLTNIDISSEGESVFNHCRNVRQKNVRLHR